jgi:hypothetical protein
MPGRAAAADTENAMIVGTVREIKNDEFRVGLTPEGAHALVDAGHEVLVERGAGAGILASDKAYCNAGATVASHASEVWERADLIVKVKEPLFRAPGSAKPDAVHVLAPGGAAGPHARTHRLEGDGDRVRDGGAAGRLAAAADPHEPDRGAHGD